jgi:hypothetical protein
MVSILKVIDPPLPYNDTIDIPVPHPLRRSLLNDVIDMLVLLPFGIATPQQIEYRLMLITGSDYDTNAG